MSTYTESLGLELITPGSQAGLWGNTTNNTFTLVDQAITGVTPISFASASGSTYTLTDYNGAANEARSAVLNITGTAVGSNNVVVPNKQKTYLVRNSTGQDVVIKTASPTATYTVGAGYSILVFCDGNNNVFTGIASPSVGTLSVNAGGTGATTFTAGFVKSTGGTNALTSSSSVALGSEVSGTLPVANGGTGASSLTSGALLVGNGTGAVAVLSGGISGYVPTWNGSTWVSAQPPGGITSVNGQTGPAVTLTASDVGALSTSGTAANSSQLGGVASSGYVATTGTQTVAGVKTFSSAPVSTGGFTTNTNSGLSQGAVNFYNSNRSTGQYNSLFLQTSGTPLANQDYVMAFNNNNAAAFVYVFNGAGTATAANWSSTSDARIKENVVTLQSGLDKLTQLRPVEFSYKRDKLSAPDHYGLIAQELAQVLPNIVDDSSLSDGDVQNIKSVSYTELIPILIKAVQELKAEVDALKAAK